MSRATSDDQLRFLLSCVKHANNGRVDFVEVAKECGVVSKGAAAKRYERLMKANGIAPSGGSASNSPSKPTPAKQKAKGSVEKLPATKKQKLERDSHASTAKRDENIPRLTTKSTMDPRADAGEPTPIKSEAFNGIVRHTISGPTGLPQLPLPAAMFVPNPSVGQGIPYATQQRSPFAGFPAFACGSRHQLVPEVPIYAPFPTALREPWSLTSQENGSSLSGSEEYPNPDCVNQHNRAVQPPLSSEGMLPRVPPQPQEVVPIQKPGEYQPEDGDQASRSTGYVVVVE